jgi:hypothetical protein
MCRGSHYNHPTMSQPHELILLSPYKIPGTYPLTLAEDEMASWLNGYSALWHPSVLWNATAPPKVDATYDHETPKPGVIYAVPESPPTYLPDDWKDRVRAAGSISFAVVADREQTLKNLYEAIQAEGVPDLAWKDATDMPQDVLSLLFGLGWGYSFLATLAESMEHENLLEAEIFWDEIQLALANIGEFEYVPKRLPPSQPGSEGPGVSEQAVAETASPGGQENPSVSADESPYSQPVAPDGEGEPLVQEDPADYEWLKHLQNAAQKLQQARDVLYPVTIHLLDLHLLDEESFDRAWPSTMEMGIPVNYLASGALLESLAFRQPEKFAQLKIQVANDLADVLGGCQVEREDPLLPFDSQLWNLRQGIETHRRLLGVEPRVFARKKFGFNPQLPLQLSTMGLRKVLFLLFDESTGGLPHYGNIVVAWTSPDGKQIDGFAREPKSADKAETFFNFAHYWFKTIREDHNATLCLVQKEAKEAPWMRDFIALSRLSPVFGTWTTFSRYLNDVMAGEYPPALTADEFHFDLLGERVDRKTPDPVSAFARHLRLRRRVDGCWTYAALHRSLSGTKDTLEVADHLQSIERTFETQPQIGTEPGGLAEIETQVTQALADRLQVRSQPNQPGWMLLNPCAFARRIALELDPGKHPLPIEGIIKACQLDADKMRAVIEVPALGFAWIPREGPAGTPPMKGRMKLGDAPTFTIRNEFFEAEVDPTTGGLKGIRDHKSRVNRVGQRLVFNPGSRMVADKIEVTRDGPALGEIVSEGRLVGEQDQTIATFRQRLRAWLGRPLLEMRIEIDAKQPPAGYPWHAYLGARFGYRDERTTILRGWNGVSHVSTHPRPQSPDFVDMRLGPYATTVYTGGLPFHQKQEGRVVDVILMPEGERATTFDLGISLDRDQPMLTAFGYTSPLAVVPTEKGPPHVGASGWLFHLDMPNLLLTRLLPGTIERREEAAPSEPQDAIVAEILECSGHSGHAEFRCVRNPKRATILNTRGDLQVESTVNGDAVWLEVSPNDLVQLQVEF